MGFRYFLEQGRAASGFDYAKAHAQRAELVGRIRQAFRDFDVLACPSMASEAFVYDPESAYAGLNQATNSVDGMPAAFRQLSRRFTTTFDFSGYPTLSLPCGMSPDGMPLSLQLVGKPLSEALLCRAGQAYEQATEWHRQHPPG